VSERKELNLGILTHVDASKTTLTERLLYEAGVIRDVGSVDAGTTQTDTLALKRQRGITIKSASRRSRSATFTSTRSTRRTTRTSSRTWSAC
jgi:translation elongation factor EF-G